MFSLGSQGQNRKDLSDHLRNILQHTTGGTFYCSVFRISLIVTVTFGSCQMIGSQVAGNSE